MRQAHEELRQLLQQRADVMRRIGTVKQTITGLAESLRGWSVERGVAGAGGSQEQRTPAGLHQGMPQDSVGGGAGVERRRDVCDEIRKKVPPMLTRHKDPVASVTTVLNRLVDYGEAQAVVLSNGRRAWRWIADAAAPMNENTIAGSVATLG